MAKDKKIEYVEPTDYIPEEIRKKYKVGEYAEDNVGSKELYVSERQVIILKSLLETEIQYLIDAIGTEDGEDKKDLIEELNACNDLYNRLTK